MAFKRPKVPLPTNIPGDFFVVACVRDPFLGSRRYELHVDDATQSSYNLGEDIEKIAELFRCWGMADLGVSAMDWAREFGRSVTIPSENRVFADYEPPPKPKLKFLEEDSDGRKPVINLP